MPATTLIEREKKEAEQEQRIATVFATRDKDLEEAKRDKHQKKRPVAELYALLDVENIECQALRSWRDYVPRSYNYDKQLIGLVQHMFVKYRVPAFLYKACILPRKSKPEPDYWRYRYPYREPVAQKVNPFPYMDSIYREWFITIAQGGSFIKKVKGFMTTREAVMFLKAPDNNLVHENIWWARLKVLGLPDLLIDKLIDKIFGRYFDDLDGRLTEIMHFFANHHSEIGPTEFGEIVDFVVWKLSNDREFRFKGRTTTSMIRLANEWHVLIQKAKIGQFIEWKGYDIEPWQYVDDKHVYATVQLLNNRDLTNEGRKQHHCVGSYTTRCADGRCSIFSLRTYMKDTPDVDTEGNITYRPVAEISRITCEVVGNTICQSRGNLNAVPNKSQVALIERWARDRGLGIGNLRGW